MRQQALNLYGAFFRSVNLIEPLNIVAVSVWNLFSIAKNMEEYCDIVLSQQGREKLVVWLFNG